MSDEAARIFDGLDLALMRQVEDAGLNASAPPQQRWVDGWLVRACPGKAKRARCINAVSAGHEPIAQKLQRCEAWFRECGLPPVVRITPFTQPPQLDAWLEQRQWARFDDTRVMVQRELSAAALGAKAADFGLQEQRLEPERYAQAVGALRGSPESEVRAHAYRLAHSPVPYVGVAWTTRAEDARPAQVQVLGQFAREGAWVGLYDVFTAPHARGRGLATSLCARLLEQARSEGATGAYLQVEADNAPARAVYARLGFADAYSYHYRAPDPRG